MGLDRASGTASDTGRGEQSEEARGVVERDGYWRPARGYAAVEEYDARAESSVLYLPAEGKRSAKTHRGRVVALGDPPKTLTGVDVPWDFRRGAVVQFHFEHHEDNRTIAWPPTGGKVVMLRVHEIDLVISEDGGLE